jgi:hypothetical protein
VAPGHGWRCGWPNSGELRRQNRSDAAGERPAGPRGPVSGLRGFGTTAGGAARRRRGRPAARARAPANGQRGLVDTRAGGVEYVPGRVSVCLHGSGGEQNGGLSGGL